jgi:hypothetical protein
MLSYLPWQRLCSSSSGSDDTGVLLYILQAHPNNHWLVEVFYG